MFWLGIMLGFILGICGAYSNFEEKMKVAKDIEELKKLI